MYKRQDKVSHMRYADRMKFWKLSRAMSPNAAEAAIMTDTPMLMKWKKDRITVLQHAGEQANEQTSARVNARKKKAQTKDSLIYRTYGT